MHTVMRTFFADLWSHRGYRYALLSVFGIISLVTAFYQTLNWSGEKRWQRVKAKLEAEGESFDFYALYPPPIPDDQNFCAIEPLNGIRTPEGTSPEAVTAQRKRDEIKKQTAFLENELYTASVFDAFTQATGPNYSAILETIKAKKALAVKGDSATWMEVRSALEVEAPILKVLGAEAERRLKADFSPRPKREELPEMLVTLPIPHLNSSLDLAKIIKFHCIVCLEAGDLDACFNSALSLLRLSEGADNTRTVIANLVAISLQGQFHHLVWLMLQSRRFDDASLARLQKELQMSSPVKASLASFRSEMAMGVASMECLERHSQDRWDMVYSAFTQDVSPSKSAYGSAFSMLIPAGFITHCKTATVELEWESIVKPLSEKGLKNVGPDIDRLESYLESISPWLDPDVMMARWPLTVFSAPRRMSAANENQRLQAIVACAVERHFLRHGSYPSTLQSLDAEFRTGNDLLDVNGEIMLYKLEHGGRFRLWSPGPDRRDDGGKFAVEIGSLRPAATYTAHYVGDWVWRYDPAVKAP
jgi:hypothetical protein